MVTSAEAGLANNSAFRYGVGLFETMLLRNGSIRLAKYHWDRLFEGMARLGFEVPAHFSAAYLEDEVLKTVKKNGGEKLCRVRLQVYGAGGGLYDREHNRPLYVVECYQLNPEMLKLNENGLVAGVATGPAKAADSVSDLKTSNALVYAMAAQQAQQNKWNDALVLNTTGNIIESTIANIFWVTEGTIFTPPLSEGCVAGVMRRHLLAQAPEIVQASMTKEALAEADEVLLTNAIRGLRWVGQCGDRNYRNTLNKQLFTSLP